MRFTKFLPTAIALTFFSTPYSFAETAKDERINQLQKYFQECHQVGQCNGSFLVAEKGKILFHQAMGQVSHKSDSELTTQSQFDIGSVTKQFTAMAIMMLQEQGKLNFDDKLVKYLPELAYKDVSIRQLLTHTSGMPDYMSYFSNLFRRGKVKSDITNEVMIKMLANEKLPLKFTPGEKWKYSNTGYALLAEVVARVSQTSYAQFLDSHIFSPLGMDSTQIRSTATPKELSKRVYGFRAQLDNRLRPLDQIPLFEIYGDGGIYSTTSDLSKWDQAFYSDILVSQASWKEAITPTKLTNGKVKDYGFGLKLKPSSYGKKKVGHGGHWRGFKSAFVRQIEDQRSIILLTNNGIDDSLDRSVRAIEAILAGKTPKPIELSFARDLYPILVEKGDKAAKRFYQIAKTNQQGNFYFDEEELNTLGYLLLGKGLINEAVIALALNKEAYPKSKNVYDSLSEALVAANKTDEAIRVLKQALVIFPDFKDAKVRLAKLKENLGNI